VLQILTFTSHSVTLLPVPAIYSGSVRASTPAYRRIQTELQKRIESGELKPGEPVESERELARRWGVSLMTARHAAKELEREGYVVRRASSGTFVAPPRVQFNKLVGFTEQIASRGLLPHSRVLGTGFLQSDEIAARLGIRHNSQIIRIERLRLAGDEPFSVETCYLAKDRFPNLLARPLDRRSLFGILESEFGAKLAYADEEVDATNSDARSAELLHVPRGAALLRLRQLLFSVSGEAIAYSLGLYRSDRHTLKLRRYR
jgi:GntR family transcriptional regulator